MHGLKLVLAPVAALSICAVLALYTLGPSEEAVRLLVRVTARLAVILFLLAFTASAFARLVKSPVTRWLMRERRAIGLSFAVTHFLHLAALIVLGAVSPAFVEDLDAVTLIGGGFAYLLLAAMTATSNDRSQAALGRANWEKLHRFGSYYIWLIFLQSYAGRVSESAAYLPIEAALVAAPAVRWLAWRRTQSLTTAVQNSP